MNHLSRRCHRGGDGRGRGKRRPDEVARDAHGVAARRREHELHLDRVAVDVGPLEGPRVDELPPLAEVGRDGDGVGRARREEDLVQRLSTSRISPLVGFTTRVRNEFRLLV